MNPATEKQARARRGHACLLTSEKHGCGESPEVEIEGITLRLCPKHARLLREIVADPKKPQQYRRRAA